jgi:hypothetical protein
MNNDVQALLAETDDPAVARDIIIALRQRINELQLNSDALRIENALLKRAGGGGISHEYVQRLKSDMRELRAHARKRGLDSDTLALIAHNGAGMHVPAPALMDQTLRVEPPAGQSLRDLRPLTMTLSTQLGGMIALTSSFRLLLINGLSLPLSERSDWRDARQIAGLGLARGERIDAVCAVDEFSPPRQVLIVSRQGWCRALPWTVVESLLASGLPMSPADKADAPAWIGPCNGAEVVLVTRLGRWVRFPAAGIEASGGQSVSLEQDDDIATAAVIGEADKDRALHFIGADGAQFAVAVSGLTAHKKPGAKTQILMRNWVALACGIATGSDAALMLGMNGDLIVSTLRSLPTASRPSDARALNMAGQRLAAAAVSLK